MGFQYSPLGITKPFIAQPNDEQTLVHFSFETNGTDVQTAYTVPAGKTFYLMGWEHHASGGIAAIVTIYETNGTTIVVIYTQLAGDCIVFTSPCPLVKYTENTYVKVKATEGTSCGWGFLV